jgi:hypothetical protein
MGGDLMSKCREAATALRELEAEREEILEELRQYANGYKGACYACEPVGMLNQKLTAELDRLREAATRVRQMVDAQALDEGLWFMAETAAEAYLQQELRRLHAALEVE